MKFEDKFGLKDGDFVEIRRFARSREYWVKARIAEIECCYYNSNGGYTASLKVIPINQTGQLGCSRWVLMFLDRKGKVSEDGIIQCRLPIS